MNTREIATDYRLQHWAGIIRERNESGLSVKVFCANAGFHENSYYYWQRRLRETACEELAKKRSGPTGLLPAGFAEVKLTERSSRPSPAAADQGKVCIESSGARIIATGGYPADKLAALMRELRRSC
jgi:hypothetical protein